MKTLYPVPPDPSTDPVSLAAAAVHSLIQPLPSGTAFCIGIVLIVMMTGRLVQTKGSLARAVLPFVVHLRWGWHRVERAMERGAFSLDTMFDQAMDWCMRQLPVEPVRLGMAQREVNAIDSSTIVRLRAGKRLALAGEGDCHRAGRAVHGAVLHPGRPLPEVAPDVDQHIPGEAGLIRLRRWHWLHYEEFPTLRLDVVRIDDPAYDKPLLVGTTASELTSAECRVAYGHRWPVETNFFVAQDSTAMEMPRAWTETALERRISVALLAGSLLKAIAAVCAPQAIGPWDRKPVRSGGRLAHYLDLHAGRFSTLALKGIAPRNYRKNPKALHINDLEEPEAA